MAIEVNDTVQIRGTLYLGKVTATRAVVIGGAVGHVATIEALDGGQSGTYPFGELELISKS